MSTSGILRFGLCVVIALVISFSMSEARPLSSRGTGGGGASPLVRGVEALIEGLNLEAIKAGGGPSPGGKGHGVTTYFTNSGPSPGGKGHSATTYFTNSGPGSGEGH